MSLLSALVEESIKELTKRLAKELAISGDNSEILNRMKAICENAAEHINIRKERANTEYMLWLISEWILLIARLEASQKIMMKEKEGGNIKKTSAATIN